MPRPKLQHTMQDLAPLEVACSNLSSVFIQAEAAVAEAEAREQRMTASTASSAEALRAKYRIGRGR